jgi:cytochrome P450
MEPLFDLSDPSVHADPYPYYHRLRAAEPVHHSPFGYWVLSRYDDVEAVLMDPRCGSGFPEDPMWAKHRGGAESDVVKSGRHCMLFLDGAAHRRIRGIVAKAFTGRSAERLRPQISAAIDRLIDTMGEGEVELISDLALPLPITVISELLGLPEHDHAKSRIWAGRLARVIDPIVTPAARTAMNETLGEFNEYLSDQLARRRANPGDDLLSLLIRGRENDEQLTDDEIISNVGLLYTAGYETTVSLLGTGMFTLIKHPDQLRYLREHPEAAGGAVDELLRYNPPLQMSARIVTDDLPVGGTVIPRGDKVMMLLAAANRDPAKFPDPDRLDLSRTGSRPLSFSGGAHYCLGAPLAKLEASLVFNALLKRYRTIELAPGEITWRPTFNVRGLEELRLTVRH